MLPSDFAQTDRCEKLVMLCANLEACQGYRASFTAIMDDDPVLVCQHLEIRY